MRVSTDFIAISRRHLSKIARQLQISDAAMRRDTKPLRRQLVRRVLLVQAATGGRKQFLESMVLLPFLMQNSCRSKSGDFFLSSWRYFFLLLLFLYLFLQEYFSVGIGIFLILEITDQQINATYTIQQECSVLVRLFFPRKGT